MNCAYQAIAGKGRTIADIYTRIAWALVNQRVVDNWLDFGLGGLWQWK
jgi:hypothetical protein